MMGDLRGSFVPSDLFEVISSLRTSDGSQWHRRIILKVNYLSINVNNIIMESLLTPPEVSSSKLPILTFTAVKTENLESLEDKCHRQCSL